MQEMILTRGIPASGKSTFAKVWVNAAPKRVRVNRDDIRFQMYGVYFGDPIDENVVTKVQQGMIEAAFKAGNSVIVDDTNLVEKFAKGLIRLAHKYQVPVVVRDFPVSLSVALQRNRDRDRKVPEDVIRKMHDRFQGLKPFDVTPPVVRPYNGTQDKPDAWIFDIDGTLAKMEGRSPYDWMRVGEDSPIEQVIEVAQALSAAGYQIIFLSGRDGVCYDITIDWIIEEVMETDHLYMRAPDDQRADNIVKAELFDNHVRDNWNVRGVFDDRDQVVTMWRQMGLQCFQVAPGDF